MPWAATNSGLSPVGQEAVAATPGQNHARVALVASCSPLSLQDPALKLCLVQSVCMVCQAICSSAHASSFHFSRKAELVAQMMVSTVGPGGVLGRLEGADAHREVGLRRTREAACSSIPRPTWVEAQSGPRAMA